MPGIATHFKILEKSKDQLGIKNMGFGYLGAIGASLGDFIPNGDDGGDTTPQYSAYWQVWNQIFALLFGFKPDDPSVDSGTPPLLNLMTTIQGTLKGLQDAVASRDVNKLKDLNLDEFEGAAKDLAKFVSLLNLDPGGFTAPIGQLIFDSASLKPGIDGKPLAPDSLFIRDLLHSRRTGTCLRVLQQNAGDDKTKAYALGYLTSFAGKVCGNPFINSIVGGPYRTQWWRHRWISNYVDAWVFGFYETPGASMSGDTPTPAYDQWKSLCDANLHTRMSKAFGQNNPFADLDFNFVMDVLRGKQQLPADKKLPPAFCNYWFESMQEAYGELAPGWIADANENRRQLVLTHAFLQLWMVLWFQTGTDVRGLGSLPELPDKKPPQCGAMPTWDGPGTQGQGSGNPGTTPPIPRPETESDALETISGIIAIIVGAAAWYASEGLLGAGLIGVGADLVSNEDTKVNWDGLECSVYWYRWYHYGFCETLHQALTVSGFSLPYASELDKTLFDADGNSLSVGLERIKSRRSDTFPAQQSKSLSQMAAWLVPPATGQEMPTTVAYLDAAYPSFFVDDHANNLGAGNSRAIFQTPGVVNDANMFKKEAGIASRTGNAIENILELFKHRDEFIGAENDFPQWNLDGDRGMYFWTWKFIDAYDTTQIQIAD